MKNLNFYKLGNGTQIPYLLYMNPSYRFIILYSHGNAEDLTAIQPWIREIFYRLGVNILAYEYTGYGYSAGTGTPSEEKCYNNIVAMMNFITCQLAIPSTNIILWGRSLGSGPTIQLASYRMPLAGIVLQSPFTSIVSVVSQCLTCLPCTDIFDNLSKMDLIQCPIYIIHGMKDNIVEIHHSRKLAENCKRLYSLDILLEAGHNDINWDTLLNRVSSFINQL